MKQQKEHWVKTLFSFAGPCKGKMTLSVLCAILSVAGGFVPFWAVYEILLLFINRTATLNNIMLWCLAVSYTHLDVYKRQMDLDRILSFMWSGK